MKLDENGLIVDLEPHEVFVFGSNLAGRHGAGAARQAREQFGARYGVGEGLRGQSYAFPTLDERLRPLPLRRLVTARNRFYATANLRPDLIFVMTKVGCGLAGIDEDDMKDVFVDRPPLVIKPLHVIKPEGW